MIFYTFCVDLGLLKPQTLNNALYRLIISLDKHIPNYRLIIYSNYLTNEDTDFGEYVEFREYYDNSPIKYYGKNEWLNLSFNKLNVFEDLYGELDESPIWVDLDTIICSDISYIDKLDNVFIEGGGECVKPLTLFINHDYTVPMNRYIQGNLWKISISIYMELRVLLEVLNSKGYQLRYDCQDLFNYYLYFICDGVFKNIFVIGNNYLPDTINGLAIWGLEGDYSTIHLKSIYDLHITNEGWLRDNKYPGKDIHILSFTFQTLKMIEFSKQMDTLGFNG